MSAPAGAPGWTRGRPGTWRDPTDDAPLLRHERRSLALGAAIAARIAENPERALAMARTRLARLHALDADDWGNNPWLGSWQTLLDGPLDEILAVLVSTTQESRDLRKNSPFAGVLTQDQRAEVLADFYSSPQAKGR